MQNLCKNYGVCKNVPTLSCPEPDNISTADPNLTVPYPPPLHSLHSESYFTFNAEQTGAVCSSSCLPVFLSACLWWGPVTVQPTWTAVGMCFIPEVLTHGPSPPPSPPPPLPSPLPLLRGLNRRTNTHSLTHTHTHT